MQPLITKPPRHLGAAVPYILPAIPTAPMLSGPQSLKSKLRDQHFFTAYESDTT